MQTKNIHGNGMTFNYRPKQYVELACLLASVGVEIDREIYIWMDFGAWNEAMISRPMLYVMRWHQ